MRHVHIHVAGFLIARIDHQDFLGRLDEIDWFDDEGGDRDGGPNDPRLALIMVEAEQATYMKVNKSRPIILFETIKNKVIGSAPRRGEVREISGAELMD